MNLLTPITKKGMYTEYLCECGNKTEARTSDVNLGKTTSCGCLRRETMKKNRKGKILTESNIQEILNHLSIPYIQTSLIAHVMGIHQVTVSKIKREYFKTVRIDYIENLENQIKKLQEELNALKTI